MSLKQNLSVKCLGSYYSNISSVFFTHIRFLTLRSLKETKLKFSGYNIIFSGSQQLYHLSRNCIEGNWIQDKMNLYK